MPLRLLISSLLAAAALAVGPGAALAADTYVNGDDGDAADSNDCTVITTPCLTIGQGLIQAGTGDTVHVDDTSPNYMESQVLDDGKSLLADDFDNSHTGSYTIFGTGFPTIAVPVGETGGTVSGFTLAPSAGQETIFLEGPATFRDNQINNPYAGVAALDISTPAGGTGTLIDHNTFNGPGSGTASTGIVIGEGTPQIVDNLISTPGNGFHTAVLVNNGADPTITGNTIQALHQEGLARGTGVRVTDAHATITGNTINQMGSGESSGIAFLEISSPTGGATHHNTITGVDLGPGIFLNTTTDPVTLEGDLVWNFAQGLEALGTDGTSADDADVTATNVTFAANTLGVHLHDAHLTLDSSIVEDGIDVTTSGGNPGCTITFSDGPTTTPGGVGCQNFQTSADPQFVLTSSLFPESNDYHLMPTSAMIDAGNPASPAAGSVDIDGDARALDATPHCAGNVNRRDMGADEFKPAALDCIAPNTLKGKSRVRKRKRRAKFAFRASEAGAHFQCKLDKKPFAPCTSPKRYRKLKPGRHKFRVRAVDSAGNADRTPLVQKFRIPRPR
jgi:hypothetical protein